MTILQFLDSTFAFKKWPTTVLVVVAYAALLSSVLLTSQLVEVPKSQDGLNITQAYADLRSMTSHPHPYNSHANDNVRSYLLGRVRDITREVSFAHIDDDNISNGSWVSRGYGVYFEGTNVLVKIDGLDPQYQSSGGTLFSAHYDSVSSASGATDDGMGVATLLQLVEYFSTHRPKRTVVFNINNGEEDWLNGAHAFLQHPWSNITDTFLNLEGAASGGRPILFRATGTSSLRSFTSGRVRHPHGNVLSADAFARGVIRSGTDYSVYTEGARMQGLDLAFYEGRSKYHTKYDAVPYTQGGKKSLWSMMEAAKGAGIALANDDKTHGKGIDKPVYFDLFGAAMVLFPLTTLTTINIIALVLGPVMIILLSVCEYIVRFNTLQGRQNGHVHQPEGSVHIWRRFWEWLKGLEWLSGFWIWAKFWLALAVTIGLQILLTFLFVKLNPFTVYSAPYIVLVSSITLAYLSFITILNIPIRLDGRILPEQQKHTILHQLYILTWFLLILSTVAIKKAQIGGVYPITIWNVLAWFGCLLSGFEELAGARGTAVWELRATESQRPPFVRGVGYDAVSQHEEPTIDGERGEEAEADPTETTPLLTQRRLSSTEPPAGTKRAEDGAIGWWILQFLVVVPLPVILFSHIGVILLAALPQTLADGSSAAVVYAASALVSTLLILPLTPFMLKAHRFLTYGIVAVFIGATVYPLLAFPFSLEAPLKVYFQQQVFLESPHPRVVTSLSGVPKYLESAIIPTLPSTEGQNVTCTSGGDLRGLTVCSWESRLIPSPGGDAITKGWIAVNTSRTGSTEARITVRGQNTRSCRLYFDKDSHITEYHVRGGAHGLQQGFEGEGSLEQLRLWSRTWDRKFVVDVKWPEGVDTITGKAACEWAEYESGMTGLEGIHGAKIPAYEEVLRFLPKWAVVSKMADGLVEVISDFKV